MNHCSAQSVISGLHGRERRQERNISKDDVDMSSLMRQDDLDGARCRSDGMFYSLATGFVESALEHKNCNQVVSVILMHDSKTTIYMRKKPMTETIYNQIINLREWNTFRPNGDCDYVDALRTARRIMRKSLPGCQFNLCIIANDVAMAPIQNDITNGSAHLVEGNMLKMITKVAREFSRRLFMNCIGIGHESDSFTVLKRMMAKARQLALKCNFHRCNLDVHSLSEALSILGRASADGATSAPTLHRPHLPRTIAKAYTWNAATSDYELLIDRRCQSCYVLVGDESLTADLQHGWKCASCQACFFCVACMNHFTWHLGSPQCIKAASKHEDMVQATIPSYSVLIQYDAPIHYVAFSGRQLRFIDQNAQVIESCFTSRELSGSNFDQVGVVLMNEIKRLGQTRAVIAEFAGRFNAELDRRQPHHHYLRLRVALPIIIEIEGGCCYLASEQGPCDKVVSDSAYVGDTRELLDAFTHYTYARSNNTYLAVATTDIPALQANQLLLKNVILYAKSKLSISDDIMTFNAYESYYRQSHDCNKVCHSLGLSVSGRLRNLYI
ncbi:hypothetical protein MPSEU_000639200 [Mayamaea pseudoterrestris]|nr:hypothetical protein MPSEU_000639200 [Mayamaea pseudoterrestris]